jgi:hypothetical protein
MAAMAAIAAIVGAIWLSPIAFGPQPAELGEISLPPSLTHRGFTPTIMARRLVNAGAKMHRLAGVKVRHG